MDLRDLERTFLKVPPPQLRRSPLFQQLPEAPALMAAYHRTHSQNDRRGSSSVPKDANYGVPSDSVKPVRCASAGSSSSSALPRRLAQNHLTLLSHAGGGRRATSAARSRSPVHSTFNNTTSPPTRPSTANTHSAMVFGRPSSSSSSRTDHYCATAFMVQQAEEIEHYERERAMAEEAESFQRERKWALLRLREREKEQRRVADMATKRRVREAKLLAVHQQAQQVEMEVEQMHYSERKGRTLLEVSERRERRDIAYRCWKSALDIRIAKQLSMVVEWENDGRTRIIDSALSTIETLVRAVGQRLCITERSTINTREKQERIANLKYLAALSAWKAGQDQQLMAVSNAERRQRYRIYDVEGVQFGEIESEKQNLLIEVAREIRRKQEAVLAALREVELYHQHQRRLNDEEESASRNTVRNDELNVRAQLRAAMMDDRRLSLEAQQLRIMTEYNAWVEKCRLEQLPWKAAEANEREDLLLEEHAEWRALLIVHQSTWSELLVPISWGTTEDFASATLVGKHTIELERLFADAFARVQQELVDTDPAARRRGTLSKRKSVMSIVRDSLERKVSLAEQDMTTVVAGETAGASQSSNNNNNNSNGKGKSVKDVAKTVAMKLRSSGVNSITKLGYELSLSQGVGVLSLCPGLYIRRKVDARHYSTAPLQSGRLTVRIKAGGCIGDTVDINAARVNSTKDRSPFLQLCMSASGLTNNKNTAAITNFVSAAYTPAAPGTGIVYAAQQLSVPSLRIVDGSVYDEDGTLLCVVESVQSLGSLQGCHVASQVHDAHGRLADEQQQSNGIVLFTATFPTALEKDTMWIADRVLQNLVFRNHHEMNGAAHSVGHRTIEVELTFAAPNLVRRPSSKWNEPVTKSKHHITANVVIIPTAAYVTTAHPQLQLVESGVSNMLPPATALSRSVVFSDRSVGKSANLCSLFGQTIVVDRKGRTLDTLASTMARRFAIFDRSDVFTAQPKLLLPPEEFQAAVLRLRFVEGAQNEDTLHFVGNEMFALKKDEFKFLLPPANSNSSSAAAPDTAPDLSSSLPIEPCVVAKILFGKMVPGTPTSTKELVIGMSEVPQHLQTLASSGKGPISPFLSATLLKLFLERIHFSTTSSSTIKRRIELQLVLSRRQGSRCATLTIDLHVNVPNSPAAFWASPQRVQTHVAVTDPTRCSPAHLQPLVPLLATPLFHQLQLEPGPQLVGKGVAPSAASNNIAADSLSVGGGYVRVSIPNSGGLMPWDGLSIVSRAAWNTNGVLIAQPHTFAAPPSKSKIHSPLSVARLLWASAPDAEEISMLHVATAYSFPSTTPDVKSSLANCGCLIVELSESCKFAALRAILQSIGLTSLVPSSHFETTTKFVQVEISFGKPPSSAGGSASPMKGAASPLSNPFAACSSALQAGVGPVRATVAVAVVSGSLKLLKSSSTATHESSVLLPRESVSLRAGGAGLTFNCFVMQWVPNLSDLSTIALMQTPKPLTNLDGMTASGATISIDMLPMAASERSRSQWGVTLVAGEDLQAAPQPSKPTPSARGISFAVEQPATRSDANGKEGGAPPPTAAVPVWRYKSRVRYTPGVADLPEGVLSRYSWQDDVENRKRILLRNGVAVATMEMRPISSTLALQCVADATHSTGNSDVVLSELLSDLLQLVAVAPSPLQQSKTPIKSGEGGGSNKSIKSEEAVVALITVVDSTRRRQQVAVTIELVPEHLPSVFENVPNNGVVYVRHGISYSSTATAVMETVMRSYSSSRSRQKLSGSMRGFQTNRRISIQDVGVPLLAQSTIEDDDTDFTGDVPGFLEVEAVNGWDVRTDQLVVLPELPPSSSLWELWAAQLRSRRTASDETHEDDDDEDNVSVVASVPPYCPLEIVDVVDKKGNKVPLSSSAGSNGTEVVRRFLIRCRSAVGQVSEDGTLCQGTIAVTGRSSLLRIVFVKGVSMLLCTQVLHHIAVRHAEKYPVRLQDRILAIRFNAGDEVDVQDTRLQLTVKVGRPLLSVDPLHENISIRFPPLVPTTTTASPRVSSKGHSHNETIVSMTTTPRGGLEESLLTSESGELDSSSALFHREEITCFPEVRFALPPAQTPLGLTLEVELDFFDKGMALTPPLSARRRATSTSSSGDSHDAALGLHRAGNVSMWKFAKESLLQQDASESTATSTAKSVTESQPVDDGLDDAILLHLTEDPSQDIHFEKNRSVICFSVAFVASWLLGEGNEENVALPTPGCDGILFARVIRLTSRQIFLKLADRFLCRGNDPLPSTALGHFLSCVRYTPPTSSPPAWVARRSISVIWTRTEHERAALSQQLYLENASLHPVCFAPALRTPEVLHATEALCFLGSSVLVFPSLSFHDHGVGGDTMLGQDCEVVVEVLDGTPQDTLSIARPWEILSTAPYSLANPTSSIADGTLWGVDGNLSAVLAHEPKSNALPHEPRLVSVNGEEVVFAAQVSQNGNSFCSYRMVMRMQRCPSRTLAKVLRRIMYSTTETQNVSTRLVRATFRMHDGGAASTAFVKVTSVLPFVEFGPKLFSQLMVEHAGVCNTAPAAVLRTTEASALPALPSQQHSTVVALDTSRSTSFPHFNALRKTFEAGGGLVVSFQLLCQPFQQSSSSLSLNPLSRLSGAKNGIAQLFEPLLVNDATMQGLQIGPPVSAKPPFERIVLHLPDDTPLSVGADRSSLVHVGRGTSICTVVWSDDGSRLTMVFPARGAACSSPQLITDALECVAFDVTDGQVVNAAPPPSNSAAKGTAKKLAAPSALSGAPVVTPRQNGSSRSNASRYLACRVETAVLFGSTQSLDPFASIACDEVIIPVVLR